MRKILFSFLIISLFISCASENKTQVDVSHILVDFSLDRFDVAFYTNSTEKLPKLKKQYPFLFPKHVHDSIWIKKMTDIEEQELFAETQKHYKDFTSEKEQLTNLFQHIKYYYPKFKVPRVVTMLTNIDYQNRVVYADSLLFISLDAYLGKAHEFYHSYPNYIKQNNTSERIVVDVANTIINKQSIRKNDRTFISKMISEGKKMYLLDSYLPNISDAVKAGYTPVKMDWAKANEEQIWKFFIENDLLYSTDTKLNQRFLEIAPFSKFYLSEDNKSPGQIGVFLGWQIVRAYMQKNDVSLQSLLTTDTETIFKKSNYKPRK